VSSVAFSPDGKRIASASGEWNKPGEVKVWDALTGRQLLDLKGHADSVNSVAFSPDGKRLASGSGGMEWEGRDSKHLRGEVKVWDAQTGQQVLALPLKGPTAPVFGVAFSPDGQRLASSSADGTVKMWDAPGARQLLPLKGHPEFVSSVAVSTDGKRIVAAGTLGEVRAWDAQTGHLILPCTDPTPPPQQKQAALPDGQRHVRIVNGQTVVGPRVLQPDDWFNRRLHDQARTHFWHLRMAREARQANDAFALHYHLRPLLLTSFTRWQDRPHDSFPFWAWRPPLTRNPVPAATHDALAVTEAELEQLLKELDRQVQAEPKARGARAARGWCRHLLSDADGARADLKQAIELHADEPGLWALRGTLCLKRQRLGEVEAIHQRLTSWQGVKVAVWHHVEADICEAEGALPEAQWHRSRLRER
jgi:hypothetical protein